jgi:predicted  nucleic acid-binding Zn-ribbon protein
VSADLRGQLERRLDALRAELDAGRRMLADLQARQAEVQDTVLRISGAIQVLEEELGRDAGDAAG